MVDDVNMPVDNLIDIYLRQEGIDRRYSQLILQELHDATEMTNEQLNQAADELITKTVPSKSVNGKLVNSKPNV